MNLRPLRLINRQLETICYLHIEDIVIDGIMVINGKVDEFEVNLAKPGGVYSLLNYIKINYGYMWNDIKSPRHPYQNILESLRLEHRLINQDPTAPDNMIMLYN